MERCISKPPDVGRACLGYSGFHESTKQGHPNIDSGLPPRGRLRYYIVESGQESMAEFHQCFHLLYLAWKLLLAANNMSRKSTPVISRHQDEHAERPLCQNSRYNPGTTQEAANTTSTPQGVSSMLNAARKTQRSSRKSITAFKSSRGNARPFRPPGLAKPIRVLLNLLMPLSRQDSPSYNSWVLTHTLLHTIRGAREPQETQTEAFMASSSNFLPTPANPHRRGNVSSFRRKSYRPDLISHDGHPNQRSYISNQAANPFTPSASTSENDQQRQRDTTVQLIKSYEESHVPAPRVQVPASGSQVPAPRSGSCLRSR
ncbi:LOW QUALITY PROTEIN: hypothetical protein HID58_074156, partial [Brassica napus]